MNALDIICSFVNGSSLTQIISSRYVQVVFPNCHIWRFYGRLFSLLNRVRISYIHGEAGVSVTENARERFGVHTASHGGGGEGVAQIVEADVRQTRPFENRLQPMISCAGRRRFLRLQQTREDPLSHRRLAPLLQHVECAGRQQDRASCLLLGRWRVRCAFV